MKDPIAGLAFDIPYALGNGPLKPKSRRPVDDSMVAAKAVVEHLRLCRWQFE